MARQRTRSIGGIVPSTRARLPADRFGDLRREHGALLELDEALAVEVERFGDLAEQVSEWIRVTMEPLLVELTRHVVRSGNHQQAVEAAQQISLAFRDLETPLTAGQQDPWRPVLGSLLMQLGDDRVADELSDAMLDVSPGTATEDMLWLLSAVRKARGHLERGEFAEAVRLGWSAAEAPDIDPLLVAEAHLIRARAFRGLNDIDREHAEAEAWHETYVATGWRGGAMEYFAAIQNGDVAVGATARRRMEEVLGMCSRLAYLREQGGEWKLAQEIYSVLLGLGYHDRVDPSMPEAGTVRERAARGSAERLPALPSTNEARPLKLIAPEVRFGQISEESAHRAVAELTSGDQRFEMAIQIARVTIAQNQYAVNGAASEVGRRLADLVRAVASENGSSSLGLNVRVVKALNGRPDEPPRDLIVVTHGLDEPELRGLGFAVRPVVVGPRLEIGATVLYLPAADRHRSTRQEIVGLLTRNLETIAGFAALQEQTVKAFTEAGQRLANCPGGEA